MYSPRAVCPCGGVRLTVGESPTLGGRKGKKARKKGGEKSKKVSPPPGPVGDRRAWAICPKLPAVENERESRCRSPAEWVRMVETKACIRTELVTLFCELSGSPDGDLRNTPASSQKFHLFLLLTRGVYVWLCCDHRNKYLFRHET